MYRIKYKSHKTTEELTALIIFAWRKNASEELNWLLRFHAVANLTRRLADTTIFDLQIGELIFHTDVLDRLIKPTQLSVGLNCRVQNRQIGTISHSCPTKQRPIAHHRV